MNIIDDFLKESPLAVAGRPPPANQGADSAFLVPFAPADLRTTVGPGRSIRAKMALAFGLAIMAIAVFVLAAIDRQYATRWEIISLVIKNGNRGGG